MSAPVGVALLGCAHTAHAWSYARALSSVRHARLVGAYDADPALAAPIGRDFEVPLHDDPVALVASADVEAVVVCSATADHRQLVEQAAAHGCHVLCEKPVAATVADTRAMIEACATADVQLHVAFVSRFLPLVQEVGAAIKAGELGQLIAMVAGNRGRPPLPPMYPAWITDPARSGGGALMDHSVHLTDIMRHLTGREVVTVAAEVESALWDCGTDDLALMSLVFDDGMVASVDPSWSVPPNNPWDYDFFLRVVGSRGSLVVSDLGSSLQLVSRRYGAGMRLVPFSADADLLMIEAFLASIRAGVHQTPCASGEDGLRALEIALAGYAAAAAAGPVTLAP